jgi:hypothetical protein
MNWKRPHADEPKLLVRQGPFAITSSTVMAVMGFAIRLILLP